MATIAWSDDLAIDGSQIDFQHRQLIDAIADLENALATKDMPRITATLPFLRLYTTTHFADEERALELIGWPKLAEHRALHRSFCQRLTELESACTRGDRAAGTLLLGFLGTWLSQHIRRADHEFSAEMRALRQRR